MEMAFFLGKQASFLMSVIITAEDSGGRIWRAAGSDHPAFFVAVDVLEYQMMVLNLKSTWI